MNKKITRLMKVLSFFSPRLASAVALKIFATPVRIPRPKSEKEMFESSKKYFLKNGIAAFEWGVDSDPLVMLIHGWNGRGTQLSAFARELVKNRFRVVALDGPGHGASSGKQTNPSHFAHFIIEAQTELDPRGAHSVIAHSFGGGCSVLAATRGLKTKSLVLVASPAFYERVVDFYASSMELSPKTRELFIHRVAKLTGLRPQELTIGSLGACLNLPALIVHDKGDNAVNFISAEAIVGAWPGSKLLATEGLGHRRILKDAKVLREVADFIGSIP